MLIHMRTTLVLDDELMKKVKRRAIELHTTVSELVNQALRDSLARAKHPAPAFEMVTYGGAVPMAHEPADFFAALEDEGPARR
jgi:hypothetical protein